MQTIINFVVKYKEYITLIALVVMSFSLISMGDVTKIGGFRTVVIGSIGWLQDIFSFIPKPGALQSENSALRELNLQLSSEVTRMRQAVIENQRLRQLIDLKDKLDYPYLTAEVVGKNTIEMRNYLTISRGTSQGTAIGMSVRNDAGLVGEIIGATENYSLVELINNRDIKIAAKDQRSRIDGVLVWEGGEAFVLKYVPKSFDVKLSDVIVTSNYSNKYPTEVPIGNVIEIKDEPGDIYLSIYVRPFVNFSTLEQVFVLKVLPNPERISLINKMDEMLKLRKGNYKGK